MCSLYCIIKQRIDLSDSLTNYQLNTDKMKISHAHVSNTSLFIKHLMKLLKTENVYD